MTEVSFYQLKRQPLEAALPKLLERVIAAGLKAVVLAESDERIEALNAQLWTYDPGSFLPHGAAKDGMAEDQPIYLTTREENPAQATVLAVADEREPSFIGAFDRCLDMFNGNDPQSVERARDRWRIYKAAGHSVTYWQQSDTGKWEKKG